MYEKIITLYYNTITLYYYYYTHLTASFPGQPEINSEIYLSKRKKYIPCTLQLARR